MINIKKQDPVADVVRDILQQEALKGNQHKIDKNKNNKIDAHDFKILRGEKPEVKEGWDDMIKAGKERAERERQERGTGKFDKKEVKPGVTQYTRKPVRDTESMKKETVAPAGASVKGSSASISKAATQGIGSTRHANNALMEKGKEIKKEEVEQIDELKKSTVKSYIAKKMASLPGKKPKKDQEDLMKAHHRVTGVKPTSEEVEQIDELKKSTLGSYVKKAAKSQADHSFDHGEDEHRQYGDPEETEREKEMKDRERAITNREKGIGRAVKRLAKEEVEQVQEREMTSGETAERERIVKGMKKGFSGFRQRYGDKAKSVMYATATKNAMKEEALEEGKRPEGDTVPFVQNANTSSSPMKKIKEVAGAAMKKISKDLKTK